MSRKWAGLSAEQPLGAGAPQSLSRLLQASTTASVLLNSDGVMPGEVCQRFLGRRSELADRGPPKAQPNIRVSTAVWWNKGQCFLLVCVYVEIYILGESQAMFTETRCMEVRGQLLSHFSLPLCVLGIKITLAGCTASTFTNQAVSLEL